MVFFITGLKNRWNRAVAIATDQDDNNMRILKACNVTYYMVDGKWEIYCNECSKEWVSQMGQLRYVLQMVYAHFNPSHMEDRFESYIRQNDPGDAA